MVAVDVSRTDAAPRKLPNGRVGDETSAHPHTSAALW
jgi:hypothetical protein